VTPARTLVARAATEQDAELLLAWRNDPATRRWSRTSALVSADDHRRWLHRALTNPSQLLLVVHDSGEPVGTVRFDRTDTDADADGSWEVSITMAPERRGRGLAAPVLATAEAVLSVQVADATTLLALVHGDNDRSLALFHGAGYTARPELPADPPFRWLAKPLRRPAAGHSDGARS
jgi:RimJ/RimL family protein N-acetyltransferase